MKLKLLFAVLIFGWSTTRAQEAIEPKWSAEYSKSKSFIENLGQFDEHETSATGKIKYAVDFGATRIFFGEKGICYSFLEATKIPKEKRDELRQELASSVEEHKQHERLIGKFLFKEDKVTMSWGGVSSNVRLEGVDETADYHNYSYQNPQGEIVGASFAKGYKKLYYRDLYPNIDVEYTVHPEIGIKYALILHPGADPSDIAMLFDRDLSLLDGKLDIPTVFGSIIDHAPITFYESDKNFIIDSRFVQESRKITFSLGSYDPTKTVVIDPWTQTPAFNTNWDVVWECERDGSGNVYILGGIMPMQVLKYSNAGALLWTYSTPYDTSNCWLGTLATDLAGNSYVTRGSVSGIQKISSAGALTWNNNGGGGSIGNSDEYWSIAFNCDQTKLIVGGTSGAFALPPLLEGSIFEINTTNGNYTNIVDVAVGPSISIPPNLQEVRSITAAPNGKYYWLTQDTIGYLNDNTGFCSTSPTNFFKTTNGSDFGYKCEDFRYDNTGICALAADENALYMNRGNQLQKRSLVNGSILGTVNIPGGAFNNVFLGGNTVSNSGIDVDDCGNIYVGSTTGVYKFNSSLVQQAFYATSFKVYDVEVNSSGEIVACGGTGTSSSTTRSGGVQTFAASACAPQTATCCNATICQPSSLCVTDAPITLSAETAGGTWSGTGVNTSGVFNPATAGVGTHIITYTLACGSEQVTITVGSCSSITVCAETNGTLTASGGTGTFSWQTQTTTTPCIGGFGTYCGPFTVAGTPVTSWTTYATGTNAAAPASWPLQVIDNGSGTVTYTSLASIPACGVTPCPTITVSNLSQNNVNCFGQTTGSASVSASGGNGSYTYNWTPGNLSGSTQSSLGAGTYTVTATDGNTCTGSTTITITQPASALSVSASSTPTNCGVSTGSVTASASGGTTGYSYSWTPNVGSTATVNNVAAGSYSVTVTDGNGCQATANTTVSTNGGPTINVVSSGDVSCFGGNDGAATVSGTGSGTLTYTWTPGNLTGTTQSALTAGSYTVTVTDGGGCTNSTTVTIDQPTAISVTAGSITPANCGVADGSASVNVTGGSGGFTYLWTPTGATTATNNNIAAGTYTVDVEDQNGCTASTTIVVTNSGGPTVTIPTSTDVSCFGGNDGLATASVTGGTAPYTYLWSPSGGTGASASNLTAGTYSVAVTDNTGCVGSATVTLTEPAQIVITETITNANCGTSDGQISTVVSGGSGSYTYSWLPGGETTDAVAGLSAGSYSVTVTDGSGCSVSETYNVTTVGSLTVVATPISQTITAGESVQLNATGGTSYSWSPATGLSCSDCPDPVATPSTTTIYTVTVTDGSGCTGTADVLISVQMLCGEIFVPTVFSPNDNGPDANNKLCVFGGCVAELSYAVYNRWGEKVFETTDVNLTECWDGTYKGKELNAGVFAYKLVVTLFDGTYIEESGNVTLIR